MASRESRKSSGIRQAPYSPESYSKPKHQKIRPRVKEPPLRKKQMVEKDFQQMKNLLVFLDSMNQIIDPFTTSDPEIRLKDISDSWQNNLTPEDCDKLANQFLLQPYSNSKNKTWFDNRFYFDWNRDQSGEAELAAERSQIYREKISAKVSPNIGKMLKFLQNLHKKPHLIRNERKKAILQAEDLVDLKVNIRPVSIPHIRSLVSSTASYKSAQKYRALSLKEKIVLLKWMQTNCERWDWTINSFPAPDVTVHMLKHNWRLLKANMRADLGISIKRSPSFLSQQWVKWAIRKLETQLIRVNSKPPPLLNIAKGISRLNMIDILCSVADGATKRGIAEENELELSENSVFKPFNLQFIMESNRPVYFQKPFSLPPRARGCHLVTGEIENQIHNEISQIRTGMVSLFATESSCSLTLNENVCVEVRQDMEDSLNRIVPETGVQYRHKAEGKDGMPSHVKSSIVGCTQSVPIKNGQLVLGTWQGIYICEHRDASQARQIIATITGTA